MNILEIFGIVILIIIAIIAVIKIVASKQNKSSPSVATNAVGLVSVDKYMFRREVEFLYFVAGIIPKGMLVFPKVGVDNILKPKEDKQSYNAILSKYVDFVVFDEATMKPLLVIDIYDNSFGDESLAVGEPLIQKAVVDAKIPFISLLVRNNFDNSSLKNDILKALEKKDNKNNKNEQKE